MWEKLIETDDIISYEKKAKDMMIRIEARLNEQKQWTIFVTHYDGNGTNYTEEYKSKTKDESLQIIKQLQKSKLKSKKQIEELKLSSNKKLRLDIVREFRDYTVEKWHFTIEHEPCYNFVIIRDSEYVDLDIVMHEKYKKHEEELMVELLKMLGLNKPEIPVRRNIFYYNERQNNAFHKDIKNQLFVGRIEFDFSE